MVYAMEKYGQGFMRVNGKRFSFSYFGKDKMVLVRFQSDPMQARSRQKRGIKVGENIYGERYYPGTPVSKFRNLLKS